MHSFRLAIPLALVILAACESSIGVDVRRDDPRWALGAAQVTGPGKSFPCNVSLATSGGPYAWSYGHARVRFPTSELADGRTVRYHFRGYDESGQLIAVANCIIPATDDAVLRMDRKLRVHRDRTLIGGSVLNSVQLKPIVAEACGPGLVGDPPACYPIKSGTVESPSGGDSGWGWGEYGGGDDGGDEPSYAEPCNTADPVVDDPDVQQGFKDLWTASDPDAALAERVEQGGWIVNDGAGGYTVQPFDSSIQDSCNMVVPLAGRPTNAVAWVHTHPYTRGERLTNCGTVQILGYSVGVTYMNDPSDADGTAATTLGLPGYFIDKDKVTRFVGDPASQDKFRTTNQYPRCGY